MGAARARRGRSRHGSFRHPARASRGCSREQIAGPGDWCVRAAICPAADGHSNSTTTSIPTSTTRRSSCSPCWSRVSRRRTQRACDQRARRGRCAMRSRTAPGARSIGTIPAKLVYRMPFCDFGAVIDPPTEDVTAHVLEMLAALGPARATRTSRAACRYLRSDADAPTARGSGAGASTTSTAPGASISALVALRRPAQMVERGPPLAALCPEPDGGWGESCHSYVDESFAGVGASTASQTAWAVIALQHRRAWTPPGLPTGARLRRDRQTRDGTWDEPQLHRERASRATFTSTTTSTGISFRRSPWPRLRHGLAPRRSTEISRK